MNSEVILTGPRLLLRDLLNLEIGDIVSFDFSQTNPFDLLLNGEKKYRGGNGSLGEACGVQDRGAIAKAGNWYIEALSPQVFSGNRR